MKKIIISVALVATMIVTLIVGVSADAYTSATNGDLPIPSLTLVFDDPYQLLQSTSAYDNLIPLEDGAQYAYIKLFQGDLVRMVEIELDGEYEAVGSTSVDYSVFQVGAYYFQGISKDGGDTATFIAPYLAPDVEFDEVHVVLSLEFAEELADQNYSVDSESELFYYNNSGALEVSTLDNGITRYYINTGEVDNSFIGGLFGSITETVGGMAGGITSSAEAIIFDVDINGNRVLSDIVQFIFIVAGLSIGMVVIYLIYKLIRYGRQR